MSETAPAAPGRTCGTCGMCCKLYQSDVPGIEKPAGRWCRHYAQGSGCGIYATRPEACRAFNCLWLTEPSIPPEWKPDKSKMVVTLFPQNGFIYVQVDPSAPSAWRKEPFYSQLHRWAERNLKEGRHVLVFVNDVATLIMPGQDLPLGRMKPTDGFTVRRTFGPKGVTYEATRNPRAA